MKIPAELLYSSDHSWVKFEDDMAIIGVSDFVQEQLGTIKGIEFPEIGDFVETSDDLCKVEADNDFTHVLAPISGYIAEINTELIDDPELMNEDSYGKGWLVAIEVANKEEEKDLMTAAEYEAFLDENN
jgi:glycine cleavage system H protein